MARILSFDFGTGGVRAGVYDTDRRQMLGQEDAPYATRYPHAGWAEQSPQEWRAALRAAGRAVLEKTGSTTVDAVCTATTASTVALCLRDGTPIAPALLWMDCRAEAEARETAALDHPVMRYCGGSDAVEWLVPKSMWLKRRQPEVWARAEMVCEALDYVNFDLTGEWVGSRMNAACKWNYDSAEQRFVPDIYEALGIPELKERLPQRIVPVGGVIAPMREAMAAELGLSNCPVVAQGGIDAHMGILGADTVEPGGMLFIGGTSIVQLVQLAEEADVPGFWGPYPNALTDGHWLVECGQVAAGSMLNWLAGEMFGLDGTGHAALIDDVAATPARADGLLGLDYMMGNRTPYRDAALRGALLGLTLGHTRADVYAAAIDSIALGSANILSVLSGRGIPVERVMMAGGIVKNPAWLQATVDALGVSVEVAREDNLSLVGASVAGATAIGEFSDLQAAAKACVAPAGRLEPRPQRAEWYARTLPLYREATEELRPVLHQLAYRQMGREGK
ncbi:FGGY-family carbohydrate kinase [Nitratireductor indicus]|uniref:FGGY-family carbohydrate kinase n=1 Tax=Nitratireductor indicus TaxID=721133 RepID=UPI0028751E71|nr:FGGY-family carbohydrate kinase [Nitratireductor indicus]MDS1134980.1 FGGY-family carbohydrate kinase [Nitratireductor indicus]